MKVAFFEVKNSEEKYLKERLSEDELYFSSSPLTVDTKIVANDFEILSVFTDSKIDKDVLTKLPHLRLIATRTTGTDHIDLKALEEKGIKLLNVPSYGELTVAEYTFALLLSLSRKIYLAMNKVKEGLDFNSEGLTGIDLNGKTIGVIGTGRIGQHVMKFASSFGMKILCFDVKPNLALKSDFDLEYVELNSLLANSDVITLHIPHLPSTGHLINNENIGLIKRGAFLINTARGAIVETKALVKALEEGILAGAALDVLEEEDMLKQEKKIVIEGALKSNDLQTLLQDHVLLNMENVIVTPHNAFNTKEALKRILDTTIENVKSIK